MPDIDPSKPQINDPELEAELIRVLSIVGPMGKLDVIPAVLPTISMGNIVQQTVEVRSPAFRTTDIFSTGLQTGQAGGTLLADTGPLADGIFDVRLASTSQTSIGLQNHRIEMRNAANTASLAFWTHLMGVFTSGARPLFNYTLALEFAINERLRIVQVVTNPAGQAAEATIFARRRI